MFFKKKEVQPSEQEMLMRQLVDAKSDLKIAEANFNNCEPDFFEIANSELTLAQQRVQTISQKLHKVGDNSKNFELFARVTY